MPFYEYECPKCGYQEEVLQKITDKPLTKCPSCGKNSLRKLMSAPLFRLKGSGWYETDFKSDKENKRNLHGADKEEAKTETKAETETAKTETPKTETAKPEAAKAEAPKPATDKPAAKPTRRSAARSKPKTKTTRTAKRLSRR